MKLDAPQPLALIKQMSPVMPFLIPRTKISLRHYYRTSFPTLRMTQLLIIVKCIQKLFETARLKFRILIIRRRQNHLLKHHWSQQSDHNECFS